MVGKLSETGIVRDSAYIVFKVSLMSLTLWLKWKNPYFKLVNCLMRPNFPTSKPFGHLIGCPIFKIKTAGHFVFFKFHLLEIFLEINAVFLLNSHKFCRAPAKVKIDIFLGCKILFLVTYNYYILKLLIKFSP